MTTLGDRLKQLREEKGLTQVQLGKIVNLSQQAIGHYEVNRAKPDYETLAKLAAFFNVSTDYLLGLVDDPHPLSFDRETPPTPQELEKYLSVF